MESFWLSKVLKNYIFYTARHARKLHLKLRHHVLISSILSIIGRFKTIIYRILNLYSIRYTDTIIDLYRCFGIGCPTLVPVEPPGNFLPHKNSTNGAFWSLWEPLESIAKGSTSPGAVEAPGPRVQ